MGPSLQSWIPWPLQVPSNSEYFVSQLGLHFPTSTGVSSTALYWYPAQLSFSSPKKTISHHFPLWASKFSEKFLSLLLTKPTKKKFIHTFLLLYPYEKETSPLWELRAHPQGKQGLSYTRSWEIIPLSFLLNNSVFLPHEGDVFPHHPEHTDL